MYFFLKLILFASTSSFADWQVKEETDLMTDRIRKIAYITNDSGHTISIYRISKNESVWMNFNLSSSTFDQISSLQPPMFRIDQNEPHDLSRQKRSNESSYNQKHGIQDYIWEPKWVNFLIWHGKEEEGLSTSLVQIMEGQSIVFRYYLSTGGYKDTRFTLQGAASTIAETIGINERINHEKQQSANKFNTELVAQTEKCTANMSTFSACFAKVEKCSKQSNREVKNFRNCMEQ